ncbi:MAG: hypothetical protein ACYDCO_19360 [Armatimonadota bacterium]
MKSWLRVFLALVVMLAVAAPVAYRYWPRPVLSFDTGSQFVDEDRFQQREIDRLLKAEVGGYRKVHVFVALADNRQGIVPVPARIGNGQDPGNNLYWGARYGIKTAFSRDPNWKLLESRKEPFPHLLERLIFRHAKAKVYLVADAYDGLCIDEATTAAVLSCAGMLPEPVVIGGHTYVFGGGADLIAYVGHNGLGSFTIDEEVKQRDTRKRDAVFLCCVSRPYFDGYLEQGGAYPLLMTTQLMCPEAYSLQAALEGWVKRESPARIHERAAQAYSHYQKCSVRAAKRLFATGYPE